ncbi:MAG: hypothetical protein KGI00_01325 [Candidatus Micrarchaeota archaeon]|nr:hypothetical protein [Candidatus Micrarchaeota archaeon]MDE1849350.1 hypothetical protein [Candidatus Micrarchaeota archaeon]
MAMDKTRMRHEARKFEGYAERALASADTREGMRKAVQNLGIALAFRIQGADNETELRRQLLGLMRGVDDARKAANVHDRLESMNGGSASVELRPVQVDGYVTLAGDSSIEISQYHVAGIMTSQRVVDIARKHGMDEIARKYEIMQVEMWKERAEGMPNFYNITSYLYAKEVADRIGDDGILDNLYERMITVYGDYADMVRATDKFRALVAYSLAISMSRDAVRPDLEETYAGRVPELLDDFVKTVKPGASGDAILAAKVGESLSDDLGYDDHAQRFRETRIRSVKMAMDEQYKGAPDDMFTRVGKISRIREFVQIAEATGMDAFADELRAEMRSLKRLNGK